MKSNPKFAIAVVAALALLAGLLWMSRHNGGPKTAPAAVGQDTSADNDGPYDGPSKGKLPRLHTDGPEDASATTGRKAPEALAIPEAPSLENAPPASRGGGGFYAHSTEDALRLLKMAIEAAGGEKALAAYQKATLHTTVLQPLRVSSYEVSVDTMHTLVATDVLAQSSLGAANGRGFRRVGELVVPTDRTEFFNLQLQQVMHLATVLVPLLGKEYAVTRAGGIELDGKVVNSVQLDFGSPDGQIVLMLDPLKFRVVALEFAFARVYFDDVRNFGDAKIPTTRRVIWFQTHHASDDSKSADARRRQVQVKGPTTDSAEQRAADGPIELQYVDRITDITPGAQAAKLKVPPYTAASPMKFSNRPELQGFAIEAGTHKGIDAAVDAKVPALPWMPRNVLPIEAFSPGAIPADLDKSVVLWLTWPQDLPPREEALAALKKLAGEAYLATKTLRIHRGDVPDKLAQFVNEVTAAGYTLAPGQPTVVHIGEPDRQKSEVSVELQVPIIKK